MSSLLSTLLPSTYESHTAHNSRLIVEMSAKGGAERALTCHDRSTIPNNWTSSGDGKGETLGVTSESQKSKSLIPVLKFCCLLASFSFWLFSADFCTRNCHWSAKAASRA